MMMIPMPESPAEAHQLLRAALLNYLYLLRTYRAVAAQVGASSTEAPTAGATRARRACRPGGCSSGGRRSASGGQTGRHLRADLPVAMHRLVQVGHECWETP
jgi:hypothetical protein